jgi:hypothetical protein
MTGLACKGGTEGNTMEQQTQEVDAVDVLDPHEYPDPTEADLKDPDFEAVWDAIKEWDLSRHRETKSGHRLYSGATGNDVMHILLALKHSASQLPDVPPGKQN